MTSNAKVPDPDGSPKGKGAVVAALLVAAVFVLLGLGAAAVLLAKLQPGAWPAIPLPAAPPPPGPAPGDWSSLLPFVMVAVLLGFALLVTMVVVLVGIGFFLFTGRRGCAPSPCMKPQTDDCAELAECLEECLRRVRRERPSGVREPKAGG